MNGIPPRAAAVLAGDHRMAGRLITIAEAGDTDIEPELGVLYRAGGSSRIIGITGPPGAGKSTFLDCLISRLRSLKRRIAVLAIDPSSPLSGGAVLGDRVRMQRHAEDRGIFIRSMAARGALGGLAHAAGDAVTILDAMAFDDIIIETVGVGQSETDILGLADIVILMQTAHGGDGIQSVKAGILEIADIIVVNKADTVGTDRMIRTLQEMVAHRIQTAAGWDTPVLPTEATNGAGIDAVLDAIDAFYRCRGANREATMQRDRRRMRARILTLAQAALRHRINILTEPSLLAAIDAVISRVMEPREALKLLVFPANS